jgi:hypothetical protein
LINAIYKERFGDSLLIAKMMVKAADRAPSIRQDITNIGSLNTHFREMAQSNLHNARFQFISLIFS